VVLAASQALFLLRDKSAFSLYYAILMGDRKASDGLVQSQMDRLKDPRQVAELAAREGVSFVPYAGIGFEAYRNIAKKDGPAVRAAAARVLASDPDPMSKDALIQIALTDDSVNVRQAALDALSQRGEASCMERLRRNLDDLHLAVRYRTAAAVLHLGGLNTNKRKAGSQPLHPQ